MLFDVSGSTSKTVRLDENFSSLGWNFPFFSASQQGKAWMIGLTPKIPLNLTVNGSTGKTTLNLSGVTLQSLAVDASTGNMEIDLPNQDQRYPTTLNMSTGNMVVSVPQGATFDMTVDGSTGNLTVDLPEGSGVQVNVRSSGPGRLILPDGYQKVRGTNQKEGVWENAAYATTSSPIHFVVDLSTGNIALR